MRNWINIALPKGRLGEKAYDIFEAIGYGCPSIHEGGRKLIFENEENGVRYFWVKPSDVAVYVERGAADIGVVGKDILLEQSSDVYELLDLGMGKCRMAVAGVKGERPDGDIPCAWQQNSPISQENFTESRAEKLILSNCMARLRLPRF